MRGISLVLAIALLSQTVGCYTHQVVRRIEKDKIDEGLQNLSFVEGGIPVILKLRPEISDTLKKTLAQIGHSGGRTAPINCYIRTIHQNSIIVDIPGYVRRRLGHIEIQVSDIQSIEILEDSSSGGGLLVVIGIVGIIIMIMFLVQQVETDGDNPWFQHDTAPRITFP